MIQSFFASRRFAVVGASADRGKFGNKCLRKYMDKGLDAVPVHPKAATIEGLKVQQLAELEDPASFGVSIITPPAITMSVMDGAVELGFKKFWLQPGAESTAVMDKYATFEGIEVIAGGPCLLVELDKGSHL